MQQDTISRCPICQGNNIHIAEWYDDEGSSTYYCVCDDCGYADVDRFDDENVAIDHWNRRVVPGYIDGDDPTDTAYDKLDDSDSDELSGREQNEDEDCVGPISWCAYSNVRLRRAVMKDDKIA